MRKGTLAVALAIDNNYTKMAMIVLDSLFGNCHKGTRYECYILNYHLSVSNRQKLMSLVQLYDQHNLTFLDIREDDYQALNHFPENHLSIWSLEMFFRLYLPKYLPMHDRILYLDADIIVRADLSHLASIDMQNKAIAASLDTAHLAQYPTLMRGLYRLTLLLKGEISSVDRKEIMSLNQINSGVLLMNLDFWREKHLLERALEMIKEIQINAEQLLFAPHISYNNQYLPPDQLFPDQDIINYLTIIEHKDAICHLPTSYNIRVLYNPEDHLLENAFSDEYLDLNQIVWKGVTDSLVTCDGVIYDTIQIIHFAGVRPWKAQFSNHPITPFFSKYAQKVGLEMEQPMVHQEQSMVHQEQRRSYWRILLSPRKMIKMLLPYGVVRLIQIIKSR
ncbi:glycosyltransferase family 8 protein [Entomospira culicis]|uniref:Glycosyltransferase family 8 protein n=1 Tax=Entomospira culicis TaxID=2719989 RepID=A0A968KXA1_9SPIO|nr:glycosyltransferase family 8 protein [Entomospira culicis]NIZ19911.1 glycosyltransferase family 8 protein [Entomospira culicis]NIZ70132.1 glycosyltransferase family 8 protein [Entomospira culicis]WDI38059.1 glycosyltransferase family 8 protein [Entomospira culicis]WDI39682.1 glycosyltransferase family 8 protein [Entomospira culicis]